VKIPAGEFQMGSEELMYATPIHTVYLDDFYIDAYEVTNTQFKAFIDANPEWRKKNIPSEYHNGNYLQLWNGNDYPNGKANHPVVYVSWYAAMAYAKWVGKRLPTEAEWEKAARGGLKGLKYPWGDDIKAKDANYRTKGEPVGLKAAGSHDPNSYGLYNMAGNVWEWCLDTYDAFFYDKRPALKENPLALPPGAPRIGSLQWLLDNFTSIHKNSQAVTKGGSYADWYHTLRVFQRNGNTRTLTNMALGFRCVRDGGST
jgi:formylglycine-generating enzyme required for sulfatase activity